MAGKEIFTQVVGKTSYKVIFHSDSYRTISGAITSVKIYEFLSIDSETGDHKKVTWILDSRGLGEFSDGEVGKLIVFMATRINWNSSLSDGDVKLLSKEELDSIISLFEGPEEVLPAFKLNLSTGTLERIRFSEDDVSWDSPFNPPPTDPSPKSPAPQVGGSHYESLSPEPIEIIEKWGLSFHEGNVLKYLARWKNKGGIEDLKKAKWYLERLIESSVK